MRRHARLQPVAGDVEERPRQDEIRRQRAYRPHAGQPDDPGAAFARHQMGLVLVVLVMGGQDRRRAEAPGCIGEQRVAGRAGCRRDIAGPGGRGPAQRFVAKAEARGNVRDVARLRRRGVAQAVVDGDDVKSGLRQRRGLAQGDGGENQRQRIGAAGHGQDRAVAGACQGGRLVQRMREAFGKGARVERRGTGSRVGNAQAQAAAVRCRRQQLADFSSLASLLRTLLLICG